MSVKLFKPSLVRSITTSQSKMKTHHCTFLSGLELSKQLQHSVADYTRYLSEKPGLGIISVGRSLPSMKVFIYLFALACQIATKGM